MVSTLQTDAGGRISGAIAEAEAHTSGEIFCVLARQVSSYRDVSLVWSASAALVLPYLLMPWVFTPHALDWLDRGWEAAHVSAQASHTGYLLAAYAVMQALVFAAVYLLTSIPGVRRFVTPRSVRRARVHRAAMEQFLAHGIHVTRARTGVLIFASLYDHQVEIVADEGIHSKVDGEVWGDAAAALAAGLKQGDIADGFVSAIGLCGQVLADHFPPAADDIDEVENKLVVI